MRFASFTAIGLGVLLAACGSGDPGVFGESSGAQQGAGGAGGDGRDGGDGGSSSSQPSPASSGAGPTTSGATSSSGDGGSSTVATVGPGASTAETSTADTVSSTAAGPTCGNGVVDGTDACDGASLAGESCLSLGFSGGVLTCAEGCTFDTSGCTRCGDGTREGVEQCDDGGVEPGDGCDAGCVFEGTTCEDPIEVDIEREQVVTITTTNEQGDAAPGSCIQATGPGRVVRVVPRDDGFLRAWVKRSGTTIDTTLRIGYACDETFVCADSYDPFAQNGDAPTTGGEVGGLAVDADLPVYVFVEAWGADDVGAFELEMTLARGRCDDPVDVPVEPGSDDGIAMWGFNGGQEGSASGSCGGLGRDVVYQLRPVGGVAFVDRIRLDVVPSYSFNAVLHARSGACTQLLDEVGCSNFAGNGGDEEIDGFSLQDDAWVFADSGQSSNGGFVLHVVPPVP